LPTLNRTEFGGCKLPPQFSCSLTAEAGRIKPGLPWPLSEAPRHFFASLLSFPAFDASQLLYSPSIHQLITATPPGQQKSKKAAARSLPLLRTTCDKLSSIRRAVKPVRALNSGRQRSGIGSARLHRCRWKPGRREVVLRESPVKVNISRCRTDVLDLVLNAPADNRKRVDF
jgi:hypothetical protein